LITAASWMLPQSTDFTPVFPFIKAQKNGITEQFAKSANCSLKQGILISS
jgi:hypothetical protein